MAEKTPNIEPSWFEVIGDEFQKPYMNALRNFLREEMKQHTVYPPSNEIFNAFWHTPFHDVKVIILGQDPYHGPNQAHGLCFSVKKGVEPPPSLINIFKELHSDLNIPTPNHGCLTDWAKQGVFLLNTSLTVRANESQSHANKGWETFTDNVIQKLNHLRSFLVFILWGKPAQAKISMIDSNRHLILTAAHPSPLSAHRGFFGSRPFSQTNDYLIQTGQSPIHWSLN